MFRVGSIYGYIGETGRIILEVIGRNGSEITVIENGARRRVLPVTFDRTEERVEVWQYRGVHGYIYADRTRTPTIIAIWIISATALKSPGRSITAAE